MSLTVAEKHALLIKFNGQRNETHDQYLNDKAVRNEEEKKSGTFKPRPVEGEYRKLYKAFGRDNKNKDVRKQLQDEVDLYTDNQLSTNLNVNALPGYSMDKFN